MTITSFLWSSTEWTNVTNFHQITPTYTRGYPINSDSYMWPVASCLAVLCARVHARDTQLIARTGSNEEFTFTSMYNHKRAATILR